MKRCPACSRTYADETLSYCLADGTLLSAPYDPEATQLRTRSPGADLPLTENSLPSQSPSVVSKGGKPLLYLVLVVLALIFSGATVVLFMSANREARGPGVSVAPIPASPSPVSAPANNLASVSANVAPNRNRSLSNNAEPGKGVQPSIPTVYGSIYDVARKRLIGAGWFPRKNHWTHGDTVDVKYGNGPIFWKRGYRELMACSPTGLAACTFEFFDPSNRVLEVGTEGEEDENGAYHAKVSGVTLKTK